jgi:hypothetical protein
VKEIAETLPEITDAAQLRMGSPVARPATSTELIYSQSAASV